MNTDVDRRFEKRFSTLRYPYLYSSVIRIYPRLPYAQTRTRRGHKG